MADVKHRLGTGRQGDNIALDFIPVLLAGFTFDRTDITFDSTERTFDEIP
jgi:hypothetical protein